MKRCANNAKLYRELLKKFAISHGSIPKAIEDAVAIQDYDRALNLLHATSGVAGNIGAVEVHSLTTRLNTAIKTEHTTETHMLLQNFKRCMNTLVLSIETALKPEVEKSPPEERRKLDREEIDTVLAELQTYLDNSDGEGAFYFDSVHNGLAEVINQADLLLLKKSIDSYNFKAATACLNDVTANWKAGRDGAAYD